MSDQGKVVITMTAPASTSRGTVLSGAGTKSATLCGVGVMLDSTDSTQVLAPVQLSGTALAILGGTVTLGASLKADANGKLVAATGDATDTKLICAIALEAGVADELHPVKIL